MINTERDDKQFRRGVVLGLTMAEILLLLIFLLMLLLVSQIDTNTKELTTAQDRVKEQDQTIVALREKLAVILGPNSEEYNGLEDYIHVKKELAAKIEELEKANLTISQSGDAVIVLERARELYPELTPEEAVQKFMAAADVGKEIIDSKNQTDSILAGAASCEANLNRCTGQVSFLTDQINKAKGGRDKPPCWTTEKDRIAVIFDISATDDGIIVADRRSKYSEPDRAKLPDDLPIQSIAFGKPRKIGQFLSDIDPIFNWSEGNNCRFYVSIKNNMALTTTATEYQEIYLAIKRRFYSSD